MKDIKAIIFDFDGVIVNSVALHEKAEKETHRKFNILVPKGETEKFKGRKIHDIFRETSKLYGTGRESVDEMVALKTKLYLEYAATELQLIPGILEFLDAIKVSRKYRCAITTSGREVVQNEIMERFKLFPYFEIVVTEKDITHGKPDPEPYLVTAEKLQIPPDKCFVIEDAVSGIKSSKAAGCYSCGITTNATKTALEEVGADMVVNSYQELFTVLDI